MVAPARFTWICFNGRCNDYKITVDSNAGEGGVLICDTCGELMVWKEPNCGCEMSPDVPVNTECPQHPVTAPLDSAKLLRAQAYFAEYIAAFAMSEMIQLTTVDTRGGAVKEDADAAQSMAIAWAALKKVVGKEEALYMFWSWQRMLAKYPRHPMVSDCDPDGE